jgi:hypothetical protein
MEAEIRLKNSNLIFPDFGFGRILPPAGELRRPLEEL